MQSCVASHAGATLPTGLAGMKKLHEKVIDKRSRSRGGRRVAASMKMKERLRAKLGRAPTKREVAKRRGVLARRAARCNSNLKPERQFVKDGATFSQLVKLGGGTYGNVYSTVDEHGLKIVLKVPKKSSNDDGLSSATLREIAVLRRLQHKNIVVLRHLLVSEIDVCMLLGCMASDLKRYYRAAPSGRLQANEARQVLHGMAEGLKFCHAHAIIHRDLKPQNVLIERPGCVFHPLSVRIADFDQAIRLVPGRLNTACVGTIWYRPPEMILGDRRYTTHRPQRAPAMISSGSHTARTCHGVRGLFSPLAWHGLRCRYGYGVDAWALGCIVVEMRTGTPLFTPQQDRDGFRLMAPVLGTPTEDVWPGVSGLPHFAAGIRSLGSEMGGDELVGGMGSSGAGGGKGGVQALPAQLHALLRPARVFEPLFTELEASVIERLLVWDPRQRASLDNVCSILNGFTPTRGRAARASAVGTAPRIGESVSREAAVHTEGSAPADQALALDAAPDAALDAALDVTANRVATTTTPPTATAAHPPPPPPPLAATPVAWYAPAQAGFIERCPNLKASYRTILFTWLIEVHAKFGRLDAALRSCHGCLHLCCSLVDRYLEQRPSLPKARLQLVGTTALLVACKLLEDSYCPLIKDLTYVSDGSCKEEEILKMECEVDGPRCNPTPARDCSNSNLCPPCPLNARARISRASSSSASSMATSLSAPSLKL